MKRTESLIKVLKRTNYSVL